MVVASRSVFAAALLAAILAAPGAALASSAAPTITTAGRSNEASAPESKGAAVADTSVDAACTRRVKVVYAGYGEAQRAECGTLTR